MILRLMAALSAAVLVGGCVSVKNENGLVTPPAFCSHLKGTIGVPKGPVSVGAARSGRSSFSVHVHDWIFSGASAEIVDMAVRRAAEQGGLSRVAYADYEQTSLFGLVSVFNIVAYGE